MKNKHKHFFSRHVNKLLILFFVILFSLSGIYLYQTSNSKLLTNTEKNITPRLSQDSYDKETQTISNILKNESLKSSFEYIENQLQTRPDFARDCHPLLHYLGHEAFHLYNNDAELALQNAQELCNAGYIHGVIQSYFDHFPNETTLPNDICNKETEWNYAKWECFHGMGHGYVLSNELNIDNAILQCVKIGDENAVNACVNGAYMERFFLTNHSGEIIRNLSEADISICKNEQTYKSQCYLYAPSAYLEENVNSYNNAAQKYCLQAETNYINACQIGVGVQLIKDSISQPEKAISVCDELNNSSYTFNCLHGVSSSYFFNKGTTKDYENFCNKLGANIQICNKTAEEIKSNFKI